MRRRKRKRRKRRRSWLLHSRKPFHFFDLAPSICSLIDELDDDDVDDNHDDDGDDYDDDDGNNDLDNSDNDEMNWQYRNPLLALHNDNG